MTLLPIAGPWRTSTYSSESFNCVQARRPEGDVVLVRDSKLGEQSPVLEFSAGAWTAFVEDLKGGRS